MSKLDRWVWGGDRRPNGFCAGVKMGLRVCDKHQQGHLGMAPRTLSFPQCTRQTYSHTKGDRCPHGRSAPELHGSQGQSSGATGAGLVCGSPPTRRQPAHSVHVAQPHSLGCTSEQTARPGTAGPILISSPFSGDTAGPSGTCRGESPAALALEVASHSGRREWLGPL